MIITSVSFQTNDILQVDEITIKGMFCKGDDIQSFLNATGQDVIITPRLDSITKTKIDKLIEETKESKTESSRPIIHNAISQLKVKED